MTQAWPEVGGTRTGRKDQRSRGDDSSHRATTLITPFPVPIRPGPPLPEVQAGLPGRLMLVGSQHPGSLPLSAAGALWAASPDKDTEANLPQILPGVICFTLLSPESEVPFFGPS